MGNEIAVHKAHQQALVGLLKEFDRVCQKLDIPYVLFSGTMLGAVRHQGFIPWDDDIDVLMLREDYERFMEEAPCLLNDEVFYLQREFSNHWPMYFSKLRKNQTTCLEKFHPKDPQIHQGICMDIFPCDHAANSQLGRKLQFFASKIVIAKSLDKRGYDTNSKKKQFFIKLCRLLPMNPFLWITKSGKRDSTLVHSFLGGSSRFSKSVYPREWFTQRIELRFEDGDYPVSAHYDALLRQLYGDYTVLPPMEQRHIKQHAILVDLDHSYEEYEHYRDGMCFDIYTRSIR